MAKNFREVEFESEAIFVSSKSMEMAEKERDNNM